MGGDQEIPCAIRFPSARPPLVPHRSPGDKKGFAAIPQSLYYSWCSRLDSNQRPTDS